MSRDWQVLYREQNAQQWKIIEAIIYNFEIHTILSLNNKKSVYL